MTSYTDLVQSAQDLLNTVLDDESQGNLVFTGMNGLPDLKINSPRDLSTLAIGTVIAINNEEWMCAEVETDAVYLAYWVCCTGPNMSHEDLYIHALQKPDNLVYCHKAL